MLPGFLTRLKREGYKIVHIVPAERSALLASAKWFDRRKVK